MSFRTEIENAIHQARLHQLSGAIEQCLFE